MANVYLYNGKGVAQFRDSDIYYKAWVVTSSTNTTFTIESVHVSTRVDTSSTDDDYYANVRAPIEIDGDIYYIYSDGYPDPVYMGRINEEWVYSMAVNKTYNRTSSARSVTFKIPADEHHDYEWYYHNPSTGRDNRQLATGWSGNSRTITIPALPSYAVTYNANGGTGAPSAQTKVYGTTLTLSGTRPTRVGYKFFTWNTKADGSGTSYAPGASYTANAALTLYAIWVKAPVVSSLTVVRSDSSGAQDDLGTYCKVTARWSVDTSRPGGNTGTVTGSIKPANGSAVAFSWSSGASGTSGTAVAIVANVDTDTQYTVTVTVTDLESQVVTRSEILTRAKFIIDVKNGGLAMGIGSAAPSSGLELGWALQCDENVSMLKNLTVSGTITQGSDRRLKEHVAYLGEDAAEFVRRLRPALYRRGGELRLGLYAQDVLTVDEWGTATVTEGAGGLLALDYAALIAPLVSYCQSLEGRIRELEGDLPHAVEEGDRG